MEHSDGVRDTIHSYVRRSLDPIFTDKDSGFTPLPETPDNRPAKKPKLNVKTPEAPPAMLVVMLRIEKMQEECLARMGHVESAVKANSASIKDVADSLQSLAKHMDDVSEKMENVDSRVSSLQKENAALRDKVEEMDSYKRRWNLRVARVEESSGENVKQLVIDLFSTVSPDIADQLPLSVDIAHRLGPRSDKLKSSRRIIVQFIS